MILGEYAKIPCLDCHLSSLFLLSLVKSEAMVVHCDKSIQRSCWEDHQMGLSWHL